MSNAEPSPRTSPFAAPSPGTIVGGRFEVVAEQTSDALGVVLAARDQKTGRPVSLRIVPSALVSGEVGARLRAEARTASSLTHKNILATYGVGSLPDGSMFVASEAIDGTRLSDFLEKRRAEGSR